jgi:Icc-related predicted phosphoesterase
MRYNRIMDRNFDKVAFCGDWHANDSVVSQIAMLGEKGFKLIIHCGDLGIWHTSAYLALGDLGLSEYIIGIEKELADSDMNMITLLGNHESYSYLDELWVAAGDPAKKNPLQITPHLCVLPRVHRFELNGIRFLALGGANSIDRWYRTEGISWWPQEQISDSDVRRAVEGGFADVMITHDSPRPPYCSPGVERILTNPSHWSSEALHYANFSSMQVDRAVARVRPRLILHGHYHVSSRKTYRFNNVNYNTTIVSLAKEWDKGSIYTMKLDAALTALD